MLPLSHTYVSTKASEISTPLLILGSILPDIATTSAQQIGRDEIHNSPKKLSNFINTNYPELTDLALGIRLHCQADGGADFYSDDWKVGYAKIEGEKISSEVADLLEIPNSDTCIVLAHNFIELAVDLHIYQNHREIWNLYSSSIEKVKNDFPKIAQCLGKYLNLDSNMINNELNNLIMFLSPQNLTSKEVSVKQVVLPLIKLRFKKDVSGEKVLNILMNAIDITKPTYQQFLDYATAEVKKNIISKP